MEVGSTFWMDGEYLTVVGADGTLQLAITFYLHVDPRVGFNKASMYQQWAQLKCPASLKEEFYEDISCTVRAYNNLSVYMLDELQTRL